jgi:hypothetical protein
MFASHPEVAIKEMLRVTNRDGSRIAFVTWPPELANGRLFETIAKYIPNSPSPSAINESLPPPSPILWGIPEVIQNRLGSNCVKSIHFESGAVNKPILSPNHCWKISITNSGSLIYAIYTLKDHQKIASLRYDIVLDAITSYIQECIEA